MRPRLSPAVIESITSVYKNSPLSIGLMIALLIESITSVYKNSPLSIGLMIALLIGHILTYIQFTRDTFQLRPVKFFPPQFQLWTLVTYWFMESNLMLLIFSLICIHLAGKLIEPLWGMRELIKFYSFNVLVTAFFCSFVSFLFYAVKTDLTMFFSWSVNGFLGLAAGIQMAVKQILPDSVLMNFGGLGRLKNTHIPLLNFVLQIIFTLMGLTTVASCFMYLSGMYFSWIYLRFYQRHSNGQRGDSSDHFSFASLFPKVLQPIVGVGASLFFRTLVKLKICRPQVKRYNLAQAGGSLISTGGPVADAQRQRQKALRDLNTRLTKSKAVEESLEWPNLMDESASPTSPAASPSPPKSPAERQEQQDRPKSADLVQVV